MNNTKKRNQEGRFQDDAITCSVVSAFDIRLSSNMWTENRNVRKNCVLQFAKRNSTEHWDTVRYTNPGVALTVTALAGHDIGKSLISKNRLTRLRHTQQHNENNSSNVNNRFGEPALNNGATSKSIKRNKRKLYSFQTCMSVPPNAGAPNKGYLGLCVTPTVRQNVPWSTSGSVYYNVNGIIATNLRHSNQKFAMTIGQPIRDGDVVGLLVDFVDISTGSKGSKLQTVKKANTKQPQVHFFLNQQYQGSLNLYCEPPWRFGWFSSHHFAGATIVTTSLPLPTPKTIKTFQNSHRVVRARQASLKAGLSDIPHPLRLDMRPHWNNHVRSRSKHSPFGPIDSEWELIHEGPRSPWTDNVNRGAPSRGRKVSAGHGRKRRESVADVVYTGEREVQMPVTTWYHPVTPSIARVMQNREQEQGRDREINEKKKKKKKKKKQEDGYHDERTNQDFDVWSEIDISEGTSVSGCRKPISLFSPNPPTNSNFKKKKKKKNTKKISKRAKPITIDTSPQVCVEIQPSLPLHSTINGNQSVNGDDDIEFLSFDQNMNDSYTAVLSPTSRTSNPRRVTSNSPTRRSESGMWFAPTSPTRSLLTPRVRSGSGSPLNRSTRSLRTSRSPTRVNTGGRDGGKEPMACNGSLANSRYESMSAFGSPRPRYIGISDSSLPRSRARSPRQTPFEYDEHDVCLDHGETQRESTSSRNRNTNGILERNLQKMDESDPKGDKEIQSLLEFCVGFDLKQCRHIHKPWLFLSVEFPSETCTQRTSPSASINGLRSTTQHELPDTRPSSQTPATARIHNPYVLDVVVLPLQTPATIENNNAAVVNDWIGPPTFNSMSYANASNWSASIGIVRQGDGQDNGNGFRLIDGSAQNVNAFGVVSAISESLAFSHGQIGIGAVWYSSFGANGHAESGDSDIGLQIARAQQAQGRTCADGFGTGDIVKVDVLSQSEDSYVTFSVNGKWQATLFPLCAKPWKIVWISNQHSAQVTILPPTSTHIMGHKAKSVQSIAASSMEGMACRWASLAPPLNMVSNRDQRVFECEILIDCNTDDNEDTCAWFRRCKNALEYRFKPGMVRVSKLQNGLSRLVSGAFEVHANIIMESNRVVQDALVYSRIDTDTWPTLDDLAIRIVTLFQAATKGPNSAANMNISTSARCSDSVLSAVAVSGSYVSHCSRVRRNILKGLPTSLGA